MDKLIDKFKIKTNNNLYNLNDIVTNVVKSKNVPLYINKVKNKQKILSHFYIDEKEFISILNKGKSKTCKEALNLFNNTKDIDTPQNKLDLQKNLLSFNGYKFLYFSVNDDIWFKGKDIATILEYENTKEAIIDHVLDEDKITFEKLRVVPDLPLSSTKGQSSNTKTPHPKSILPLKVKGSNIHPHTIFINESGLYSLIMSSKKPKAKEFKRWVTKEVLPSIRKTGTYTFKKDVKLLPDLNQYDKKSCFYLLNIKDNIYKYGISRDIQNRITTHKRELNFEELLKIYTMIDDNKSALLETKIKRLAKQWNIACNYENKTECFQTNDICKIDDIINKIEDYREEIISEDTDDVQLDIQREITKQKEYSLKEKEYSYKEKEISYKEKEIELLTSIINKYDGKYLEEIILRHYNIMNTQLTNTQPMDIQEMDIQEMDIQEMDIQEMDTQPMDIQEPDSLIDSMSDEIKSNSSVIEEKVFNKTKVNCEKKENKCLDCKTLVFRNSLRCLKCENIRRYDMNKGNRPSQQQILNDLKSMSYVKVGQKYGVSDNCIRKWLRKYERYS